MRHQKRNRSISEMIAALIVIAIVAFAGIMLFLMMGGFFRGGGTASLSISATGYGSNDGRRASITLVIQNTGDGVARIGGIYVAPETSGVSVGTVTAAGVSASALSMGGMPSTGSMPSSGIDINAKDSRTLYLQLTNGQNLYPGAQLKIYVVYYDVNSGRSFIADTVVTLR